ncbi:hypothetical protein H696_01880 [Fonticula alba]|uniref:Succinate dehydrogenase assembly factor 3 n=1 Tax=Fonticula alba TaxID=691883 RepID=A0A058Z9E7_FONAL|nr:hypothetical protein H696_01880 [Fonticula alba]KCV70934.1 hypothetical protein H696_01880 [Fonticula alba]|eukprot:XP_009494057.1 hypothetical protein H696_01880 [Fonticula alba]
MSHPALNSAVKNFPALTLYRQILRAHRALPMNLAAIGNAYVRDEFRRHKEADPKYVAGFMAAWTDYLISLESQLKADRHRVGTHLDMNTLDKMSDEQIGQLSELKEESVKPVL